MLATLVALIVWFAGVVFTVWLLETYFPTLPKLVRAVIAAAITILLIRLLQAWVCSWLCRPFLP